MSDHSDTVDRATFGRFCTGLLLFTLAACQPGPDRRVEPVFSAIGTDEIVSIVGNEPFWGGTIQGDTMVWTTPENPDGVAIAVTRFAGNGGLGWSGSLDGEPVDVLIASGPCSDGMSDRKYPYSTAVSIGERRVFGCAYTDQTNHTDDTPQPAV